MKRSTLALCLAAAAPLAPAAAQQQPVLLRVTQQQGNTARLRTEVETWLSLAQLQAAGADTTQPMSRLVLYLTRTVQGVRGDTIVFSDLGGSVTMSATYTLERTVRQGASNVAVIGFTGQLGGGGPDGAIAMRVTGRLEYDMTQSMLVRLTSDMSGQVSTAAGSIPARIRRTVTRI